MLATSVTWITAFQRIVARSFTFLGDRTFILFNLQNSRFYKESIRPGNTVILSLNSQLEISVMN